MTTIKELQKQINQATVDISRLKATSRLLTERIDRKPNGLPPAGAANSFLKTDGAGNLHWGNVDDIIEDIWVNEVGDTMTGILNFDPGSDIDMDMITVQVDGIPTFGWDQNEDQFNFTRGAEFVHSQNNITIVEVINTNGGTNASAGFAAFNTDAAGHAIILRVCGTGYTGASSWQDSGVIRTGSQLAGGLKFVASDGGMRFSTVGEEVDNLAIDTSGGVFINRSTNTFMTVGLTINQGVNDDEILTLKSSSDVAHGMTSLAETDTYGVLSKVIASAGGLRMVGYKDADATGDRAIQLVGRLGEAATTLKTTAARGIISLIAQIKSGTSIADVGANGNLMSIQNNATARWILDAEGDIFYGGSDGGTITDHLDDALLLSGFRAVMSPKDSPAHKRFKGFVHDAEVTLVQQGVLTARLSKGGLVSDTGLKGLLIDAIIQLKNIATESNNKIVELTTRIIQLEERLANA